jgi:hypothetical protein
LKALTVTSKGIFQIVEFGHDDCLQILQDAVSGYVEAIDFPELEITMWINEEGKLLYDPESADNVIQPHPMATILYRTNYKVDDTIIGNVAFTSSLTDNEGRTKGLSNRQIQLIEDLHKLTDYEAFNSQLDKWVNIHMETKVYAVDENFQPITENNGNV